MRLFILTMFTGMVCGRIRGGRVAALADVAFRLPLLLWAALLLQLGSGLEPLASLPSAGSFAVLMGTYALVGLWLLSNLKAHGGGLRMGVAMLGVGWLLNLGAMIPNAGMPVSRVALDQIGVPRTAVVEDGFLYKHVAATDSSSLLFLGDVIPAAWLRSVLSVGDLVMAAGLSVSVACGMSTGQAMSPATPKERPVPAA